MRTWIRSGGASLSTFQPAPGQLGRWETPLIVLAVLLIVTGVGYGMGMLAASRRDPKGPRDGRKTLPPAGAGRGGRGGRGGPAASAGWR